MTWTTQLADQLDWHWHNALRPRLSGLTDDEYFWEPVADCWTVHGEGRPGGLERSDPGPIWIDFAYPPPQPEPVTTIAWRLAHVIVGVLAMRNHSHFDGPAADYQSWPYATDAATALTQLDDAYAGWISGVRGCPTTISPVRAGLPRGPMPPTRCPN